jgi:2-polyprenyl-3-methyl-5-hydroxy-6-metoxy-1,4-benzoquinol methylase
VGSNIKKFIRRIIYPEYNGSTYNLFIPQKGIVYQDNREFGVQNVSVKISRSKMGIPFELSNEIAINRGVVNLLKNEKKILNFGCGTGLFESFAAKKFTKSSFVANDLDKQTLKWAKDNRPFKNVRYENLNLRQIYRKYGKFDLALAIEVIEHVDDYLSFLKEFSKLSDVAIISTPNRDRNVEEALSISPSIHYHVREWNAGEFYWILKGFYKNVELFTLVNDEGENVQRVGTMHSFFETIAYCKGRTGNW